MPAFKFPAKMNIVLFSWRTQIMGLAQKNLPILILICLFFFL